MVPSKAELATATALAEEQQTATVEQAHVLVTAQETTQQCYATQTTQAALQGTIVFAAQVDPAQTTYVYTIQADGSGMQRISTGSDLQNSFDISPDGQYMVYESLLADEEYSQLFLTEVDGGESIRLTNRSRYDWNPQYSPDGSKILFLSESGDNNWQVYVMNADGSGIFNLSKNSYMNTDPVWFPDGSEILYLTGLNPLDTATDAYNLLAGKSTSGVDKSIYLCCFY